MNKFGLLLPVFALWSQVVSANPESPSFIAVVAHELAHQWWGNLITCADWSHFWLNEGMVVFMVAAYKEFHWGKAYYDRELDIARERYAKAVKAGYDFPLAYSKAYPSLQIKRAIT